MMSSLSASPLSVLEILKSSFLQLWMPTQDHGVFSIGIILGLIVLHSARYLASPFRKLPPGPRGYPVIGNLLETGSGKWLKYAEWHKKYVAWPGDLIYLNAAGQPVVIINSQKVAVELLDRRGAIYSDRPSDVVVCDIMTGGYLFGFARAGETWRRMRKAANERLSKSSVKGFYDTQMSEAVVQASDFLVSPARWDQHFRRAAASTILSVVYGYPTLKSEKDHILEVIDDFVECLLKNATMGAHMVQFFPWLRHLPSSLAKWKRDAEAWFKQDTAMFEGHLHTVEANVVKGNDHQSVEAILIREKDKNKFSSIERAWLGGALYAGGADSNSIIMSWWLLAMLAYSKTQARAQAELDAVVGRARLPTFADYSHLPYIRAMAKEALRWRPVGPLAMYHRSTEDDWYEGMFIPKGTLCIPNVWHMNRDPEIFGKNPEHFDPERYLDAGGEIAPVMREEGHFSYGFGRRSCVGRHMANNSLFINIAILLWATKIDRKKDAAGRFHPLDLDGWVDVGLAARPIPFELEISPRFPEASAMLAQERELRGL